MTTWFESIGSGILFYIYNSVFFFFPLGIILMLTKGKINALRFALEQLFFLYMCCLFAVVFLPLPTMEAAANLSYRYQVIPFYFIVSLIKEPCASGVLGVLFNILLTIPFGIYLRYNNHMNKKNILLLGLALTLFIEIAQLTGLFFYFKGSYRLFDMDDLIQNTLGSYLGYLLAVKAEAYLPVIEAFDVKNTEVRDLEDTIQVMYIS